MDKLRALVGEISRAGDAGILKGPVSWMQNRRAAEGLASELEGHQNNISHALLALAASVDPSR